MYSVVLMAALTAGTSTPTWGCHGCHGGFGGFGCHGFFAGCRGGSGGCYGGSGGAGYGAYGGCYGCYGGACYGGGYSYTCYGSGGYGYVGGGCQGCHGGPAYAPTQVTPPTPSPGKMPEQIPPPKKEEKGASLNQARLIVELPADAKLYVDDRLTKNVSARRVFNSPQLEEGQIYYYVLRAEVVRDGQTLSEIKRVLLHAGDVIQASFRDLGASTTARAEASAGQ